MQGEKDSCVFSSAVSGLAFIGDDDAADMLKSKIEESVDHGNPMQLLYDIASSKEMRGYTAQKFKRGKLNPLADISLHPTVLWLLGNDGGGGHAITIVNNWIFDATLPHALPLNQESLNWCCSSDSQATTFKEVNVAIRLCQSAKKQKTIQ